MGSSNFRPAFLAATASGTLAHHWSITGDATPSTASSDYGSATNKHGTASLACCLHFSSECIACRRTLKTCEVLITHCA